MTDRFVRSGAGGAATGVDWANAFLTMTAAFAAAAAGDRFWLADDHAESTAGAVTLTGPGTSASPCKIFCVDHTVASPGSGDLKTTGTISTTAANSLTINGFNYWNGVIFTAGSGASGASLFVMAAAGWDKLENCSLRQGGTAAASIWMGGGTSVRQLVELVNTTVQFGNTGSKFEFSSARIFWRNTASAILGATLPTSLFNTSTANQVRSTIVVDGVDLSALGSGKTLVPSQAANADILFVNCKLGASVTVAATPANNLAGTSTDLIACDSGTATYRQERYRYEGTLTQETTIVRSGGASDGTTPISHKIVSTANVDWTRPFESFPIAIWNSTTGSSVTATVEIAASGALNNDDVWLEVEYLGSASSPQASFATSTKANNLATGTALAASSATWASSPGSPQKLSVSFTPQMAGYIRATVKVGKASQTVYVDPLITLS